MPQLLVERERERQRERERVGVTRVLYRQRLFERIFKYDILEYYSN